MQSSHLCRIRKSFCALTPIRDIKKGLTHLLYEPSKQTKITADVVFVHGFRSCPFDCWVNAQDVFWPSVYVPEDYPKCRVWSVGYDLTLPEVPQQVVQDKSDDNKGATSIWSDTIETTGKFLNPYLRSVSNKLDEIPNYSYLSSAVNSSFSSTKYYTEKLTNIASSVFSSEQPTIDTEEFPYVEKFHFDELKPLPYLRWISMNLAESLLECGVGRNGLPVVFICHSMGGLVIKYLVSLLNDGTTGSFALGECKESEASAQLFDAYKRIELLSSLKGIFFIATPNFGSPIASFVSAIDAYINASGHPILKELSTEEKSPQYVALKELNSLFISTAEWRRTYLRSSKCHFNQLQLVSLGETEKAHGLTVVVPQNSADLFPILGGAAQADGAEGKETPGIASSGLTPTKEVTDKAYHYFFHLIPSVDHYSIQRPESKESMVYLLLRSFLNNTICSPQSVSTKNPFRKLQ